MARFLVLSPQPMAIPASDIMDRGSEVVFRSCAGVPKHLSSAQDWALADLAVLSAGQHAKEEGFDALCLTSFGDYGWTALQSVLDIPVVSAGRSSLFYALTLGTYFAVLTEEDVYHRTKKLVWEYGLDKQCVSVRQVLSANFEETLALAKQCVVQDGADVLCLTKDAPELAAHLPVPVIEPVALTLKLAESLLGLNLSHSRHAFPAPMVRKSALITALAQLSSVQKN